ncbi:phage portal protein [Nocardia africana]
MLLNNGQSIELAPQGLAELVPQVVTGYYYPDVGFQLERNFALYGEMYRAQPWIRTVVDKRANAVARLTLEVWNEAGRTRTLDETSGYSRFCAKPCPFMSPFRLWNWTQSTVDIYGETYWALIKDKDGKPTGAMPMHPSRVAIKRHPDTGEYLYTFQSGAGPASTLVTFKESEVVAFRLFNPLKLERGLSRLESLKSTLMAEDSSRNALSAAWNNGGRPGMVLSTDKALGPDGRKRLKEAFEASYSGSSQAGKTLVLEDGVKPFPVQLTAVEMQFIETRQLNREEVCAVYDVAPPIVHILDRATFSNISAQMRAFYRDTMAPVLESLEDDLDSQVGAYFQGQKTARFAVDEVLRGDWETRADAAARLATVGGLTPNEVRELMGYSRFEGPHKEKADMQYANAAMQPLGEPAERITLTGPVGHDPDGVALQLTAQGAPSTHVPSPSGAGGVDVPQLTDPATPPLPAEPDMQATTPKHLRAVKGAMGRGRDIREFALQLAEKCPDDLEDILRAVAIAIEQRDSAA